MHANLGTGQYSIKSYINDASFLLLFHRLSINLFSQAATLTALQKLSHFLTTNIRRTRQGLQTVITIDNSDRMRFHRNFIDESFKGFP